jgi:hypothetical protein
MVKSICKMKPSIDNNAEVVCLNKTALEFKKLGTQLFTSRNKEIDSLQ